MPEINADNWVEDHGDYLYNYALVRVSRPEVAEDLVQETFLAGIRSLASFEHKSSVQTWLVAILKRKIIDYYRKRSVISEEFYVEERFGPNGNMQDHWLEKHAPDRWQVNSDELLENDELKKILQACIRHLPEKWASCFILRVMEEMKGEVVCKELNISPSNMWVMLHRARLQLRDCLEKGWFNQ
ncbi:sigma-70 family RNA polymerase sigma factor [Carboxylicivirga sediminis]|uniref:RNA polymerase sigma factor n=1 Tax=Carboxylicivirga sediminis TaxID=2006564 RepID=A0A941F6M5_9BACT|nr:sigma-70 family RNA polymerase sigma factor [Carboxylicivirga sediminis]MBR8537332.1 sigma-70 family RNA polymerase sigma factor [Carboxylicivirga sediminis]